MTSTISIAIFGLGEAGGAIATDLAKFTNVSVHGFDPRAVPTPVGVQRHDSPQEAVRDASLICALTASADATKALTQIVGATFSNAIYADFSTSAAGIKQELSAVCDRSQLGFVDVALMSPVPGNGITTPALASGPSAHAFIDVFKKFGMPVEYAGAEAGQAATRKLLRSIVIKGFAALVIESMEAANAAGLGKETWENLVEQFAVADSTFMRRLVTGTYEHSLRRLHEMEAAEQMVLELGLNPVMTRSTVRSLMNVENGTPPVILPNN
jgi:3-hydroxyisobutyrate dehydrogenase-like beta-hydroxyacid dehydrogenase